MTSKPEISSLGDVYFIKWTEEKVKVRVQQLREEKHALWCEMWVTNGETDAHLLMDTVNISSGTARKRVAKSLEDRVGLDWDTMMEQLAVKVIELYRRGDPVMNVGDLEELGTPKYRLYPYILEGEINSLYAEGGKLKSYDAIFWSLLVQCGVSYLGLEPIKGNVLYLDWETSPYTLDARVKKIKQGMGIESKELLFYRRCQRPLASDITQIQAEVLNNNIQLVIVDSVGMASGLDREYHAAALDFLRALRSLEVSALCIDHKPKHSDTMFGSVYKFNEVRSAWEIDAEIVEGQDYVDLIINHKKMNDGPLVKPHGYRIEFNEDGVVFRRQSIEAIPELEAKTPLRSRIYRLLAQGPLPVKDIATELGHPHDSVKTTLNRNPNLFIRVGNEWGLIANEP